MDLLNFVKFLYFRRKKKNLISASFSVVLLQELGPIVSNNNRFLWKLELGGSVHFSVVFFPSLILWD